MRRRTIVTTTALFACATTALTACSGSGSSSAKDSSAARTPAASASATPKGPYADLTGGQIVTNAFKATRQATSMHLKMNIADAKDGATKMDLSLSSKGDCTGTIGQGKDTIRIIKVGKTVYVNPQSSGGKWVKSDTTGGDGKELASSCSLDALLSGFQTDETDTAARKGGTSTVDGHPAIVLKEDDGDEHYTIDVATTGKPYLLKLVTVGGDSPGTMEFSKFNEPVHAVAPPKSQVTNS